MKMRWIIAIQGHVCPNVALASAVQGCALVAPFVFCLSWTEASYSNKESPECSDMEKVPTDEANPKNQSGKTTRTECSSFLMKGWSLKSNRALSESEAFVKNQSAHFEVFHRWLVVWNSGHIVGLATVQMKTQEWVRRIKVGGWFFRWAISGVIQVRPPWRRGCAVADAEPSHQPSSLAFLSRAVLPTACDIIWPRIQMHSLSHLVTSATSARPPTKLTLCPTVDLLFAIPRRCTQL